GPLKPSLPLTVAAWIKMSGTGFNAVFAADNFNTKYAGYLVQINQGVLTCQYGDGGGTGPSHRRTKTGSTIMAVGQWYHVAAVIINSSNMHLYINGVDDGGAYSGTGGSMVYSATTSKIGSASGVNYFNGVIDDVRVYNTALFPEEVHMLATNAATWYMDE